MANACEGNDFSSPGDPLRRSPSSGTRRGGIALDTVGEVGSGVRCSVFAFGSKKFGRQFQDGERKKKLR